METKQSYLEAIQKQVKKSNISFSHTHLRRKIVLRCVFAAGIAMSIFVGLVVTKNEKEKQYIGVKSDVTQCEFENLDYKDSYKIWNEFALGNDVNVLLSRGNIYNRNGVFIHPENDAFIYENKNDTSRHIISENPISYINMMNDLVVYRDDNTRKIFCYDVKNNSTAELSADNCGEVFVSNGTLYFVSYTNGSKLMKSTIDGTMCEEIIEEPVLKFAVCGNEILYLTTDYDLVRMSMVGDSKNVVAHGVEQFYITDKLVMKSGNTIFTCAIEGNNAKKIYTASNPNLSMIGVASDKVFIQDFETVNSIDLKSEEIKEIYNAGSAHFWAVSEMEDGYHFFSHSDSMTASIQLEEIVLDG